MLTFSFPLKKSSILFRNTDEYGTNSKTDQKLKKGNYLETCYDWTPWNIKKLSQFRFVQLLIILKIANKLFPYLYSTMCKFIEKKNKRRIVRLNNILLEFFIYYFCFFFLFDSVSITRNSDALKGARIYLYLLLIANNTYSSIINIVACYMLLIFSLEKQINVFRNKRIFTKTHQGIESLPQTLIF